MNHLAWNWDPSSGPLNGQQELSPGPSVQPIKTLVSFLVSMTAYMTSRDLRRKGFILVYDLKAQPIRVCNMKLWVGRSNAYLLRGSGGGQGEASGEQGL